MIGWILGLKAVWHDRAGLVFSALALAAALTPILLVWGLKSGLVESLLGEMKRNPSNLAIVFRGNGVVPIGDAELTKIRALPGAGLVEPMPRAFAATVDVMKPDVGTLLAASLLPTGDGEPLLPSGTKPPDAGQIALTASLAEKLKARSGEAIVVVATRRLENVEQRFDIPLTVAAIVPNAMLSGERALVRFEVLDQIEAFLDGYDMTGRGMGGRPLAERLRDYESIRFYARTLNDVQPLDTALREMGFDVASAAAEVDKILRLDHNLTSAFLFVAGAGAIGFAISFGAALAASLAQKRRHLSLIRLIGAPLSTMLLFPLAQAIVTTGVGICIALAAFQSAAIAINTTFAADLQGASICVLTVAEMAAAAAATAMIATGVAVLVGLHYTTIAPAEVLHAE